jgi:hypothetical protein
MCPYDRFRPLAAPAVKMTSDECCDDVWWCPYLGTSQRNHDHPACSKISGNSRSAKSGVESIENKQRDPGPAKWPNTGKPWALEPCPSLSGSAHPPNKERGPCRCPRRPLRHHPTTGVSISFHRHVTQALMSPPSPFHSFSSHSETFVNFRIRTPSAQMLRNSCASSSLSTENCQLYTRLPKTTAFPSPNIAQLPSTSYLSYDTPLLSTPSLYASFCPCYPSDDISMNPTTQGHSVLKTCNTASGTFLCLLTQFFFSVANSVGPSPIHKALWLVEMSECSPKARFTFALGPCVRFVPWSGTV